MVLMLTWQTPQHVTVTVFTQADIALRPLSLLACCTTWGGSPCTGGQILNNIRWGRAGLTTLVLTHLATHLIQHPEECFGKDENALHWS
eukprot:CAMPEP_0197847442 /NCGR_PEP_ID=MMETSP1438-20131217/6227_1 /TAXON_ID=1461541 /ORGANISM="Pterosperma sp., Strain CCMP1384" /LENGTH=88 /DNA_ID=CAMNT_0043459369 /DNA_START=178 /DNA_END=444 /DNA_ORIENTATION=-